MPDLRKAGKANIPAESTSSGQSAILQAINSLRNKLLVKMDEKAEMQNEEIHKQISGLRDELKAAIDQANIKANALEERTTGLETAANTHSDAIANLEQQVTELKKVVLEMSFHNNTELDFISHAFGRWNE
ncbi:hypothetical protein Q7C36_022713 [Tachysurus vachellii]|uniref:Uncharacterized protein n=1 Tax=Tachysurus vachellii TaxID=175792 RepID=A0AA88IL57_TACVA|nr:hypothetical protein Q7C36_022713 [Tachysurus vachellii]